MVSAQPFRSDMLILSLLSCLHAPCSTAIARERNAPSTLLRIAGTARLWPAAMSDDDRATLHKQLMRKVETMDSSGQGIFNEDVTAMIAPYFPAGQSFKDAAATVRDQGLGDLQPFKGKTGPGDGTMFVSSFSLMNQAFAHVFVVLHFGFRKVDDRALALDHVRAFMRSQSM